MLISLAARYRGSPITGLAAGSRAWARPDAATPSVVSMRQHETAGHRRLELARMRQTGSAAALAGARLRGQRVEEADGCGDGLVAPERERALEPVRLVKTVVKPVGDRDELLSLRQEQRLRVCPGAVEERELDQQFRPDVAIVGGRPGQPG